MSVPAMPELTQASRKRCTSSRAENAFSRLLHRTQHLGRCPGRPPEAQQLVELRDLFSRTQRRGAERAQQPSFARGDRGAELVLERDQTAEGKAGGGCVCS